MNLETTSLRGRPRNRWQDEVSEDGRITGGEEWQGKVYNREEWKKLLRTARNRRILLIPVERINEIELFCSGTCGAEQVLDCNIQWNLGSRTPLIMNKSAHEQIFREKSIG
jgi:hypothetical protein